MLSFPGLWLGWVGADLLLFILGMELVRIRGCEVFATVDDGWWIVGMSV